METNALQNRERASDLIAIVTNKENLKDYERSLTLEKIISNGLPIHELQRAVGLRQVAIALDLQLSRLVSNLNLKWTLNDQQVKLIVDDLLTIYPNETLEDFILCFKKARQGAYGDLIRLDAPVIFSWMKNHLDEKYQLIEARVVSAQQVANKENEINYEAYRQRVANEERSKASDKLKETLNGRKRVVDHLVGTYRYFQVRNVEVYATSQEHAEQIIAGKIKSGELIEVPNDDNEKP